MLCNVMLCYVMLCYAMLRYVMIRYVMICYVTLFYVTLILCYVFCCTRSFFISVVRLWGVRLGLQSHGCGARLHVHAAHRSVLAGGGPRRAPRTRGRTAHARRTVRLRQGRGGLTRLRTPVTFLRACRHAAAAAPAPFSRRLCRRRCLVR